MNSTSFVARATAFDSTAMWILRIGVAGCFVGHGAFGLLGKSAWVPYFAVAGIGESLAWRLMPWIGALDVAVGVLALVRPCRALFLWAALWATWTALLRPFSGESGWEFVERAGNYGVPFAVLAVVGSTGPLWSRLPSTWSLSEPASPRLFAWALWLTTAALLAGHAGLGLFAHKAGLARLYGSLGLNQPASLVPVIGAAEFFLVTLLLLRPTPRLLIAITIWKLTSESLFVVSGAPAWEVVERCGSYAAPLALAVLLAHTPSRVTVSMCSSALESNPHAHA